MTPGSPLAVPAGLVGRVVTVGRGMSRAQLLLDVSAAAGARIARTGELGVVRGDGRGALTLNNIATTSSVARGDLVESAGIDGIYPRGVPIGSVGVGLAGEQALPGGARDAGGGLRANDGRAAALSRRPRRRKARRSPGARAVKIRRIALLLAAAALLEFFVGGSSYAALLPVDWFLLATAAVARSGDFVRAVLAGAAAGFFEDALSQPLLGVNAFAKAMLGFALTLVSVRVVFGGALAVGAALAAASLANEAIVALSRRCFCGARWSCCRATPSGAPRPRGSPAERWRPPGSFPWRDWWKRRRLRRLR